MDMNPQLRHKCFYCGQAYKARLTPLTLQVQGILKLTRHANPITGRPCLARYQKPRKRVASGN